MSSPVVLVQVERRDDDPVAVIRLQNPPVNVMSRELTRAARRRRC
jgi:enoyl-CoA hydratase/carnithine racemase